MLPSISFFILRPLKAIIRGLKLGGDICEA